MINELKLKVTNFIVRSGGLPTSMTTLAAQGVFLGTGVVSTCAAQMIYYEGAGDQRAMLTPLCNYLGMMLVGILPDPSSSSSPSSSDQKILLKKRRRTSSSSKPASPDEALLISCGGRRGLTLLQCCIYASVVLDFLGCTFCNIGLSMAGSGMYQVAYSSVVCWSALISQLVLKRRNSTEQWVGIGLVTFGLAFSAMGESTSANTDKSVVLIGCLNTLIGAGFYGGNYVAGEFTLKLPQRPCGRQLCMQIGTICVGMIACYQCVYVLPQWDVLVGAPMRRSNGSSVTILLCFLTYTLSQVAHGLTYFMILDSSGAVTTGIMQSLRAVCVFALSSLLFCSKQESQCYNTKRGMATLVVIVGVLYYSWAKGQQQRHKIVKKKQSRQDKNFVV